MGKEKEVIRYIRIPINHESGPRTFFELGRGINAVRSRGMLGTVVLLLFYFF